MFDLSSIGLHNRHLMIPLQIPNIATKYAKKRPIAANTPSYGVLLCPLDTKAAHSQGLQPNTISRVEKCVDLLHVQLKRLLEYYHSKLQCKNAYL